MRRLLAVFLLCSILPLLAGDSPGAGIPGLQALIDERDLIRLTNEIDVAVDRKEWDRARGFFADQIRVDFTSLVGGQPAVIKADDLIGSWKTSLFADKKTLHLRGNHLVTLNGDKASVYSHGYAWNQLPGFGTDLWEVWGNYLHEMERTPQGWKVVAMAFNKTYERGNSIIRNYLPPGK
jgi:hypothetical protein